MQTRAIFFDWYSKSDSYKCLIGLLEEKIKKNDTSLLKYINSSNQIIAYKMIIIVGLCFNLMALLEIFGFGAKFDSSICFGFVLTIIGICLAAKRRRDELFIMKALNKVEK